MKDKKNKKPIIISIVAIILVIIAGLVVLFTKGGRTKYPKVDYFFDYPKDEIKVLEICKTKNCGMPDDKFHMISVKDKYNGMAESIREINRETEKYYNEVKNSDFSAKECSKAKDLYNYSKYIDVHFDNYDKYLQSSLYHLN